MNLMDIAEQIILDVFPHAQVIDEYDVLVSDGSDTESN